MTKINSRPVRLSSFQIYEISVDDNYEINALSGEFVKKSDVHYCAEKDAIDFVAHYLEHCGDCPSKYLLYKVSKAKDEKGSPKSVSLVSVIYADDETKQVVID